MQTAKAKQDTSPQPKNIESKYASKHPLHSIAHLKPSQSSSLAGPLEPSADFVHLLAEHSEHGPLSFRVPYYHDYAPASQLIAAFLPRQRATSERPVVAARLPNTVLEGEGR